MKRIIYLVIDQLAGHWEESVIIEGTDLGPVHEPAAGFSAFKNAFISMGMRKI